MLRRLLLSCLLLVAVAHPASAQYGVVELAWGDCGAAGVAARMFACGTNTGADAMVVSFRPGNATDAVYQLDVDLAIGYELYAATPIPDWWSIVPAGGCRPAALSVSADFSSSSGACADPWLGLAFTSKKLTANSLFGDGVLRRVDVHVRIEMPYASAPVLDPGTDYYGVQLSVNHQKTVGTGSCPGCSQPICIGLVRASTLAHPDNPVSTSLWPGARRSIVWNGGTSCDRLVPVRNSTWGAIKSLYD